MLSFSMLFDSIKLGNAPKKIAFKISPLRIAILNFRGLYLNGG
jgi:hypothetical protein